MSEVTLREIAERLGGELIGDGAAPITAIGPLATATATTIAFLSNPQYVKQLASSAAGCVIVAPAFREVAAARGAAIVSDDPYLYFARLTQWWAERTRPPAPRGIHASAVIDPGARIGADVSVGAFVADAGARSTTARRSGRTWSAPVAASAPTRPPARQRPDDDRCALHRPSGAVLGADGLASRPTAIRAGSAVVVGDDVEIGANTASTAVRRNTVIGDGVKIDNLVMIATTSGSARTRRSPAASASPAARPSARTACSAAARA